MKCKHEPCNNDAMGKGSYCSNTCKTLYNRNKKAPVTVAVTPAVTLSNKPDVYGRPAIKCSKYTTRPMPLDPTDQPHPGGRGKYTRQDGTTYQFDSSGKAHDDQPASDSPTPDQLQAARDRRTDPDKLNWGERMTFNELNQAGLKGNRIAIPGDWDYVKVTQ